jgi:Domain of unknown function (DUF4145)
MQSWWELGEWTGYSGGDLAIHNITCAFCLEGGNFRKLNHWQKESSSKHKILNYDILQCENCGNLTMVFWSSGSRLHDWRTVPWPLRLEKAPESWPTDVGRYWLQARRAQEGNNWDAAAVMARSALQLALRHAGAKGKDLYHEIDDLAAKGELPPRMKEWAHEVRLLARDPAHPEPGDKPTPQKDVQDAMRFLDFLLEYLFTLPHDIATYRNRKTTTKT